jgi:hypothetical protein|tara:strand:- start:272 stop:529 length:258 start_codon:yes stop_codon:yes gene_type:complete
MDSKKVTYIWEAVVNNIARKVAEEPMEDELENWIVGETEDGHMPLIRKPQHVIDEDRADEIRQLRKEQAQMEMYDDPYLNWSGHR